MKQLKLLPLPYAYDALEPVISKQIMELHHDKHHAAYVNAYNAAIEKEKTRDVMRDISFNYNGAMLHDLFWQNMQPVKENNLPPAGMFADFEKFKKEFANAAVTVEGSGWAVVWLMDGELVVGQLEKHNLLGLNGAKPVLVLDVWEHAYYPQYLNNRAAYAEAWWQVVNWEEVEKRIRK